MSFGPEAADVTVNRVHRTISGSLPGPVYPVYSYIYPVYSWAIYLYDRIMTIYNAELPEGLKITGIKY